MSRKKLSVDDELEQLQRESFTYFLQETILPKRGGSLLDAGHEIQRTVGTREPSTEQLEVGRAALDEILRVEGAGTP